MEDSAPDLITTKVERKVALEIRLEAFRQSAEMGRSKFGYEVFAEAWALYMAQKGQPALIQNETSTNNQQPESKSLTIATQKGVPSDLISLIMSEISHNKGPISGEDRWIIALVEILVCGRQSTVDAIKSNLMEFVRLTRAKIAGEGDEEISAAHLQKIIAGKAKIAGMVEKTRKSRSDSDSGDSGKSGNKSINAGDKRPA